jgi:citrate lyase subunit beta/citryl-CoA lyase
MSAPRRWRSLLFVPAHEGRFVARAHERGADAIILDLEDAVPAAEKDGARAGLPAAARSVGQAGADVMVRVNHGIRPLARDIEAAVVAGIAALVLPKVESADWVAEVAAAIAELEHERDLPAEAIRLVLQIETPGALPRLPAIAAAHPRIAAITLGPEDFCAALGAAPGPEVLMGPNLAVLQAACAAGVQPLGIVGGIGNFSDLDAYRALVTQARSLGFRGAMAVHPAQIAVLNDGFSPPEAEVAWARRVVAADQAARADGRGAFRLDGRMIDAPVVRRAEEILARAGLPVSGLGDPPDLPGRDHPA